MTNEICWKVRPWLGGMLLASSLALSACGGGEGPGIPTAVVPAPGAVAPAPGSAGTAESFAGVKQFIDSLVALIKDGTNETSEPVAVADSPAPVTEIDEPSAVDI